MSLYIKKLYCKLFGHKIVVEINETNMISAPFCKHCDKVGSFKFIAKK